MYKSKQKSRQRDRGIVTFGIDNMELSEKKCIPCAGGIPPLNKEECEKFLLGINNDWALVDVHHLERIWKFENFIDALEFTNQLGEICEEENHHADFEVGWGRVKSSIFTHKIEGLTESDFILAAKFDKVS